MTMTRVERRRRTLALLLSLLIHALLLSLSFGGQGLGLPGFSFPWQARRAEAPDLRVLLVAPRGAAPQPLPTPAGGEPPSAILASVAAGPARLDSETTAATAAPPRRRPPLGAPIRPATPRPRRSPRPP